MLGRRRREPGRATRHRRRTSGGVSRESMRLDPPGFAVPWGRWADFPMQQREVRALALLDRSNFLSLAGGVRNPRCFGALGDGAGRSACRGAHCSSARFLGAGTSRLLRARTAVGRSRWICFPHQALWPCRRCRGRGAGGGRLRDPNGHRGRLDGRRNRWVCSGRRTDRMPLARAFVRSRSGRRGRCVLGCAVRNRPACVGTRAGPAATGGVTHPCAAEPGGREWPSRDAVNTIVDGFARRPFPMRLGPPDLRKEARTTSSAITLDTVLQLLLAQARLELAWASRHEGAPIQRDTEASGGQGGCAPLQPVLPTIRRLLDGDVEAAFAATPRRAASMRC